jgi:hypothetical protein
MSTDSEDGARGRVIALTLSPELTQWVEGVAADDGLSLAATVRRLVVHAKKNASAGFAESARAHS